VPAVAAALDRSPAPRVPRLGRRGFDARRVARSAVRLGSIVLVVVGVTACQGASTESLAAGYTTLASAANAASAPLLATLVSIEDTAARAPVLRGLADVEKTFADGLAALPASGDVKTAADEVIRLAREREAAFRAAAQATGTAQAAALAPILGEGGAAFHAAVERLRSVLGLPLTDASPTPTDAGPTPGAARPGGGSGSRT
jgi:hypothetical protein